MRHIHAYTPMLFTRHRLVWSALDQSTAAVPPSTADLHRLSASHHQIIFQRKKGDAIRGRKLNYRLGIKLCDE